MKLLQPETRLARSFFSIFLVGFVFSHGVFAQTKKPAAAAKPAVKKTSTASKDAKKVAAARTKKPAAKTAAGKKAPEKASSAAKRASQTSARGSKNTKADPKKPNSKQQAAKPNSKAKPPAKMTAAERRKEAARKRAEEARRQAALAEQRRREQAAREARARKLAFERGLKTETAANILNDSVEGEDLPVREAAVNALGDNAGTVVVMEAKTGRIVTMVNQDWAIRQGFKPCSTIKLVTGVAGLNEKLIEQDGTIAGNGMRMSLDDALARSNNAYFQRVGANLGSEKMIDYATRLGLGQKTGINAEGENPGKLPFGNNNARIYSHADDFAVTPLQLAVMVTAIANGGERVTPQIRRSRVERASLKPKLRGKVDLPDSSVQRVIPGMIGAAEYGTARRGVDPSLGVAGKTGSCVDRGSWVGLFASVAPVEDPKYAVVVITRGEGERGRHAAAIAGQVYRALGAGIQRDHEKHLALKQLRNTAASSETMASADGDEEEEDDPQDAAEQTAPVKRPVIVAGSGNSNTSSQPPAGRVVKTGQSKPVFPPVVIPYKKDAKKEEPAPSSDSRPRVIKN